MHNVIRTIHSNTQELPKLITINIVRKKQNQTPKGHRKGCNANYN